MDKDTLDIINLNHKYLREDINKLRYSAFFSLAISGLGLYALVGFHYYYSELEQASLNACIILLIITFTGFIYKAKFLKYQQKRLEISKILVDRVNRMYNGNIKN